MERGILLNGERLNHIIYADDTVIIAGSLNSLQHVNISKSKIYGHLQKLNCGHPIAYQEYISGANKTIYIFCSNCKARTILDTL